VAPACPVGRSTSRAAQANGSRLAQQCVRAARRVRGVLAGSVDRPRPRPSGGAPPARGHGHLLRRRQPWRGRRRDALPHHRHVNASSHCERRPIRAAARQSNVRQPRPVAAPSPGQVASLIPASGDRPRRPAAGDDLRLRLPGHPRPSGRAHHPGQRAATPPACPPRHLARVDEARNVTDPVASAATLMETEKHKN
jgi:hypothetical protein